MFFFNGKLNHNDIPYVFSIIFFEACLMVEPVRVAYFLPLFHLKNKVNRNEGIYIIWKLHTRSFVILMRFIFFGIFHFNDYHESYGHIFLCFLLIYSLLLLQLPIQYSLCCCFFAKLYSFPSRIILFAQDLLILSVAMLQCTDLSLFQPENACIVTRLSLRWHIACMD